jgi:hypothetical protein
MQAFCIPTEGDNDADLHTHEIAPKPAPRVNEQESRLILDSLREAAVDGLEALQARFKSIPNSPTKTSVWTQHQGALKATAVARAEEAYTELEAKA